MADAQAPGQAPGQVLFDQYLEQARNYYNTLTPLAKAQYREEIKTLLDDLDDTDPVKVGDDDLVGNDGRPIYKGEYRIKMNEIIGKGRMYGGIGTAGVLTGGIGTAGVLTGGIGTAGVLTGGIGTGGARDFVSRMDGGAKRMMMELKDKPDRELKQLYHDLGKGMFQAIKRVLADEMEMSMSVKPRKSAPRKSKVAEPVMEAKTKRSRKPAMKHAEEKPAEAVEKPAEAVEEQRDIVKEQMVQPVPKIIRRRIVRKNPQGSILKSGNPDGSITAKGEVDFPGQSVPTRAEIIQATSGTGGGMIGGASGRMIGGASGRAIGGAKPKRQASAKMKARGDAVRQLMKERGMTLGQASKYLKEHPEELK